MPSRLVAVTYDAEAPEELASFWGGVLDREVLREAGGALLPGNETQVGLRFVATSGTSTGRPRLHLHLTSTSPEDQRRTVSAALALGGRHLDIGQLPEEGHVVLADPEGNELCVIEPGNRFLAGCGYLGEVASEGSRSVGLFWRDALGWPLVWDQDGETAIQSPAGGTKLSWGGPPFAPKRARNPQRFDLTALDLEGEVLRLLGLGATRLDDRGDGVELSDPDGNEFSVLPTTTRRELRE